MTRERKGRAAPLGGVVAITAAVFFAPDWFMATVGLWMLSWSLGVAVARHEATGSFRRDRAGEARSLVKRVLEARSRLEDAQSQHDFTAGFLAGWNAALNDEYQPRRVEDVQDRCRADYELFKAASAVREG